MLSKKWQLFDWILLGLVCYWALDTPISGYRSGLWSPRVGLVSGFLTLAVGGTIALLTIRSRHHRLGLPTPRSLLIGAIAGGVLSAGGLWLMLGNEMSEKDLMMTALSSKPISEIQPEEKALVVQFLRKEIARDRDYKQIALQTKPPEFPLFSNGSFGNEAIMQREVDWFQKAVARDASNYDQHEHNLEEFRSLMMKRHAAFLVSFNLGIHSKEESFAEILSLEKQLLDATVDLYGFAARNRENIIYFNGNFISHDPAVWNAFAEKRRNCISIYQGLRPSLTKWLSA
jgi:hypothetical protein